MFFRWKQVKQKNGWRKNGGFPDAVFPPAIFLSGIFLLEQVQPRDFWESASLCFLSYSVQPLRYSRCRYWFADSLLVMRPAFPS